MGIIESIVLSLSLAIDATAVSITNGLVYTHLSKKKMRQEQKNNNEEKSFSKVFINLVIRI